jgi:malate dehydrogenase (oxaloacetate-decarboxylating)(NADP+)
MVTDEDIKKGALYPPLKDIRKVSAAIAKNVILIAGDENVFGTPQPPNLKKFIERAMYDPCYCKMPAAAPKARPGSR